MPFVAAAVAKAAGAIETAVAGARPTAAAVADPTAGKVVKATWGTVTAVLNIVTVEEDGMGKPAETPVE